jgi:hypothetical protein
MIDCVDPDCGAHKAFRQDRPFVPAAAAVP